MKQLFIGLQTTLMNLIVMSLLVLLGFVSIAGVGCGIVAALMYHQQANGESWRRFLRPKPIIRMVLASVVMEVICGALYWNLRLLSVLPTAMAILLLAATVTFGCLFIASWIQVLWMSVRSPVLTLQQCKAAFLTVIVSLPRMILLILGLAIVGLCLWLVPVAVILLAGGAVAGLDYGLTRINRRLLHLNMPS